MNFNTTDQASDSQNSIHSKPMNLSIGLWLVIGFLIGIIAFLGIRHLLIWARNRSSSARAYDDNADEDAAGVELELTPRRSQGSLVSNLPRYTPRVPPPAYSLPQRLIPGRFSSHIPPPLYSAVFTSCAASDEQRDSVASGSSRAVPEMPEREGLVAVDTGRDQIASVSSVADTEIEDEEAVGTSDSLDR